MDKRSEKRIKHSLVVVYGPQHSMGPGLTRNLSGHGMQIYDSQVFPINSEINVMFNIDDIPVAVRGTVRWNCEYSNSVEEQNELGIYIPEPPAEFLRFVECTDRGKSKIF
jgi:hypothetical protein